MNTKYTIRFKQIPVGTKSQPHIRVRIRVRFRNGIDDPQLNKYILVKYLKNNII